MANRSIRHGKLYNLLYPYMKDRFEQTNNTRVEVAKKVMKASL